MPTALEFAASFGRRKPNPQEVEKLHRLREQDLAALATKDVITVEDIQALEWGVKFEVANKFFDRCDDTAKHALLHDQHHAVRAAAQLFKPAEKRVPPAAPTPAPIAQATAAEMALVPVSLLVRAESFIAGFEGDEMQEGVDQLLEDLRASLKPIR
jgi:hypothetical protein